MAGIIKLAAMFLRGRGYFACLSVLIQWCSFFGIPYVLFFSNLHISLNILVLNMHGFLETKYIFINILSIGYCQIENLNQPREVVYWIKWLF